MLTRADTTGPTPQASPAALARALAERLAAEGRLESLQFKRAERVASETGERIDTVLVRLGIVSEAEMADAAAEMLGLARAAAADFPAEPPHLEALGLRFLAAAKLLPLEDGAAGVAVAAADPFDRSALEAVALKLGRPVAPVVALATEIETALERLAAAERAGAEDPHETAEDDMAADVARLRDMASEAPVIRLVNLIIRKAVESRASDIHIEPVDQGLRVRLRIDGALREIEAPPGALRAAVISRIKIMAKLNIAEQRLPQDGRIQIVVAGRELDLRVATLPTLHGEGVVLRLLDRSGLVLDFDGLGFDDTVKAALTPLIEKPNGIFLVTGPTGSGKTTTLYAAIARINAPERKIITIEDPVEYQLPGVTQIQVKAQIDLTFARGLRAILRQDPDVIMIGEIRDLETAQIAVQAALTGHLVLATLHTNSAAAAINRLRDMGVEDYLITATLVGVMAQRLVRRLCAECAGAEDPALVARVAPGRDPAGFRAARGCAACGRTGYRGRTGVVEVLPVDDRVRRAVLDRADQREIERVATEDGMRSMRAHGIEKAARGETALAEVLRVATEI